MKNGTSNNFRREEAVMRMLYRVFARAGVTIRREKLTCGSAYRAKSGSCFLSGQQLLFVKRLAPDQQLSVIVDYVIQLGIVLTPDEQSALPASIRELITARVGEVASAA